MDNHKYPILDEHPLLKTDIEHLVEKKFTILLEGKDSPKDYI